MPARDKTMPAQSERVPARVLSWRETIRSPGFISVLLALATLAVFWPVTGHDFLSLDDQEYVTANAHVQGGPTWDNVSWALTTGHASNWHPVTWLSHALDCQLFGLKAGAHHLVSVGFHVANTLLVFLLFRRMTGALWRSAFVAALFALHPLHVESVAWVSERKDVLSTFFWNLALLMYVRYVEQSEVQNPKPKVEGLAARQHPSSKTRHAPRFTVYCSRFYILSLLLFALSLMSKPMAVSLPFVLLLLDFWPLRRFEPATLNAQRSTLWKLLLEKLPFFALAAVAGVITFVVQKTGGAVADSVLLGVRLGNTPVSYVRYIGKMFWPENLSILYLHPGRWPAWEVAASTLLLLFISSAALVLSRRRPYLAVGWFWFLGTLVPAIGLVQVGIQAMADRYTYVPFIGLFILLAWGIGEVVPAGRWQTKGLAGSPGLVLVACAFLTARQIRYWRDSETLFGHALQVAPDNFILHNVLGAYLSSKGRYHEAISHFQEALRLRPEIPNPEGHNNLGYALASIGRSDEAIQHYREAIRLMPSYPNPHNNLGIVLAKQKQFDDAISEFQEAFKLDPGFLIASNNLATARAEKARAGSTSRPAPKP
jgi:protein O-mannosyl-transferase